MTLPWQQNAKMHAATILRSLCHIHLLADVLVLLVLGIFGNSALLGNAQAYGRLGASTGQEVTWSTFSDRAAF